MEEQENIDETTDAVEATEDGESGTFKFFGFTCNHGGYVEFLLNCFLACVVYWPFAIMILSILCAAAFNPVAGIGWALIMSLCLLLFLNDGEEDSKKCEEQATEIESLKRQIAEKRCEEQAREIEELKKQLASKD